MTRLADSNTYDTQGKKCEPNIFYPAKLTFKHKEQRQMVGYYMQEDREYYFHKSFLKNREKSSDN